MSPDLHRHPQATHLWTPQQAIAATVTLASAVRPALATVTCLPHHGRPRELSLDRRSGPPWP